VEDAISAAGGESGRTPGGFAGASLSGADPDRCGEGRPSHHFGRDSERPEYRACIRRDLADKRYAALTGLR
jgi:hypothetical protein